VCSSDLQIPGLKSPAPKPLIIYKTPTGAEKTAGMAEAKTAKASGMEGKTEGMAEKGAAKADTPFNRGPRQVPA
jgi:hypothetical protein